MKPIPQDPYSRDFSYFNREHLIRTRIVQSDWWDRASRFVDSHYSNTSGVMLVDHLEAVYQNVDSIFSAPPNAFLIDLFKFISTLGLDVTQLHLLLKIVALLHDIGKTEDDKSVMIPHPLFGYSTVKRHSVVSVYAAMEILEEEELLSAEERALLFSVIEEHDVSFGLFKEYKMCGWLPSFERWKILNDKISTQPGVGLLYLLIFKLADIHGHANIEDVTWFYHNVNQTYFSRYGFLLPLPAESDIR